MYYMINSIMDNEFAELDSSWIEEFDNFENEYKNYYAEEILFINVHSIYVDRNNDIIKMKEEKILLKTPGSLDKEELLTIIKHNSVISNIKYSLLSILNFDVNIEPVNLTNFLKNKDKNIGSSFLHTNNNIDNIKFDKSIPMFHDINDIIIIFIEKNVVKEHRIFTKKTSINSNTNKKTKRKQLKETITI
jgi:hypothetical protein